MYDTILGLYTEKAGFSVWMLFEKILLLLKIFNPGQRREGTSSLVKSLRKGSQSFLHAPKKSRCGTKSKPLPPCTVVAHTYAAHFSYKRYRCGNEIFIYGFFVFLCGAWLTGTEPDLTFAPIPPGWWKED